jgi:uncharacterized protein
MTNSVTTRCPFIADRMLTESQFFVGRQAEIKFVMGKMANAQPTSINIVGDRRIGKSSLLYRICQDYENLLVSYHRQPIEFIVVYLSLADARCQGVDNFYQAIADKLLARQVVNSNPSLADPLRVRPLNGTAFNRAMEAWKSAGVLPVICLDDFETLLNNLQQFNDGFYDNLRSLIDSKLLMLVIASRSKIEDYRQHYKLTSNFFNLTQCWDLKVFSEQEASDLVRLPQGAPALTAPRQQKALAWGEKHPYLLQAAGMYLWEEQQQGHPEGWAEQKFRDAAQRVPRSQNIFKQGFRAIARLGKLGQQIGDVIDDAGNFFKGLTIIVMLSLFVIGIVKWKDLSGFFQNTMTDIFKNADTKTEGK